MDRELALTRQQDGTYLVERAGAHYIAPVSQRFDDDAIDRLLAVREALRHFGASPDEQYVARATWKVAAYTRLIELDRRDRELVRKRSFWQGELATRGR